MSFSLCRKEEEEGEADPGVIVLFGTPHDVDQVLHLPAVANIVPPLQPGKKHYLPIG